MTATDATKPAVRHREVDAEGAGQRLDNFVLASLKGVPRSHVYRLIRSGQVRVNSGRSRPGYRLREGDRVRLPPVRSAERHAAELVPGDVDWLGARIVYEDDRLLVLDKPAGVAVHGGSGQSFGVIEALRALRPKSRALELVHRLDRDTSGCLLVAKRRSTLRSLHALLREGRVEKRYLALVRGDWQHGSAAVDAPLAETRTRGRVKVSVDPAGRPASSTFRLIERFGRRAAYVEVTIATGRTHQIRVHAASTGHPVAGDERYGDTEFNERMRQLGLRRMFLHAHSVAFTWPDGDAEFSAAVSLPQALADVLDKLGENGEKGVRPQGV